ncbi:tetratricopeptide repeat protein [Proteiniclasticum ruminis]|uniref:TolA-binding protein n=1 Tax=Proteiniclasticum ruminis TaxID=398199 RepID=A0A1I5BXY7_9CLOT|nr:tetratricopeptide repeat protein [Proteiniclasticum ruminis]SFN79472.1 TolA-binding protein [Proteiniclasticum ruminis]
MKEKIQAQKAYEDAIKRYEEKDLTGALALVMEALKMAPKDPDFLNLLGLLQHLLCDFEKATAAWQKSFSSQKTGNKAKEYLSYYSSEEFKTLREVYLEGERSLERKEYEKAYGIFELLLSGNRNLVGVPLKLAECALGMKEKEKARTHLEEVLLLDARNPRAKELLESLEYRSLGKGSEKTRTLLFSGILLLLFASLLFGFYRYSEMEKELKELKLLSEDLKKEAEGYKEEKEKLEVLLQQMETEEAPGETKEEEVAPEEPISGTEVEIFEEGLAAYRAEDYEKAIRYFAQVVDEGALEAYRSEAVYFLSATYKKLLNPEKVKEYYRRYMEEFPGSNYYAEVLYHYGLLLYEEGDLTGAKEVLQRIPEEVPESPYNNSRVEAVLEETP